MARRPGPGASWPKRSRRSPAPPSSPCDSATLSKNLENTPVYDHSMQMGRASPSACSAGSAGIGSCQGWLSASRRCCAVNKIEQRRVFAEISHEKERPTFAEVDQVEDLRKSSRAKVIDRGHHPAFSRSSRRRIKRRFRVELFKPEQNLPFGLIDTPPHR